jgi:hypothetical protein
MPRSRVSAGPRATATRSRVTNNPNAASGLDGRSSLARRFRDIFQNFLNTIGRPLDEQELAEVRRCAELSLICEEARAALMRSSGSAADLNSLLKLENVLARAERRLRFQPGPAKPVTSLADHIARLKDKGAGAAPAAGGHS